ncbi:hypothetical protein E6W17_41565 [Streptomyces sp. A1547]|nr:hypothetical protein E6W17_41565 [Streptomyces sp. A1547]
MPTSAAGPIESLGARLAEVGGESAEDVALLYAVRPSVDWWAVRGIGPARGSPLAALAPVAEGQYLADQLAETRGWGRNIRFAVNRGPATPHCSLRLPPPEPPPLSPRARPPYDRTHSPRIPGTEEGGSRSNAARCE